MKLFDFVEWVLSVYINPLVSSVGMKLFDFTEFSLCISANSFIPTADTELIDNEKTQ
jgi:hypothetical protein